MSMLGPTFVYPPSGNHDYETFSGSTLSVPYPTGLDLPIDIVNIGADLADVSSGTPVVRNAGVYAWTATILSEALTAGATVFFYIYVNLDPGGVNAAYVDGSIVAPGRRASGTVVFTMQAGAAVGVFVQNADSGAGARDFIVENAFLQRLV